MRYFNHTTTNCAFTQGNFTRWMMSESKVDLDEMQNFADSFRNDTEDSYDEDDNSGFWEREVKYDPSMVKAEVDEEPEDPIQDHFLTSALSTANDADAEFMPSKIKPQRRRRKKLDSDDDGEDKNWSPYSSKLAKSKPMSVRTKKKNKKVAPEKRKLAAREKGSLQRNRKDEEESLKCLVGEDEDNVEEKFSPVAPKPQRKSTCRRKKASEMTPQELEMARKKWREEARIRRRGQTASRLKCSESDVNDKGERPQKDASEISVEDEWELKKAKWRETARIQRQRRRERMTDEEREAYLAKAREQKRKARAAAIEKLSPEELTEFKRQEAQRQYLAKLHRRATMTEEEIREEKQRSYMRDMARLASLSWQELEQKRVRKNERAKQRNRERRAQRTEEDMEKHREAKRQYFNNMSPEKKARFKAQQKEYNKRKMEKLKQDPEEFAKWKENTDKRKKQMKDLWTKFKKGVITKEELAQLEIKMHMGRGRGAHVDETPEQRLQRFAAARKEYVRRTGRKKRLKLHQKGKSLDDIKRRQRTEETAQQREHRLMRHRVNAAKNRTQKRLQASGVHPVEIERKLIEVEEICKAKPVKPYKPRKKRKQPKSQLTTTPNESELEDDKPSLSSFLVERQVVDNSSSLLQPHRSHLFQQQEQPAYQIAGSSQNQAPFMYSTYPDSFNLNTQESASSSSHLEVASAYSHINYTDSKVRHDYASSSASYEAMSSPAPSFPDPSSPPQTPKYEAHDHADSDQFIEYFTPSPFKKFSDTYKGTPTKKRNVVSDYFKMGKPRGPQKNRADAVERNMMCPDCGICYSQATYYGHRRLYHNPNFKDGHCLLCGEEFSVIRDWYYKHYRIVHAEAVKRRQKRNTDSTSPKRRKRGSEKDPNLVDSEKRKFLCTQCGKGYVTLFGLQLHEKFVHGDSSKEENYLDCRFCKQKFKHKQSLDRHLIREHGSSVWNCEKCDKFFKSSSMLYDHYKEDHENSYFACEFCKAVHTSEVAIKFHTNSCKKAPMERLLALRKKWKEEGDPPVSSVLIGCEFCPASVSVHSLGRHYIDVHGLPREESHSCNQCSKTFKRREFAICHLAGIHSIPISECLDLCRPYNVKNREGLEPKVGKTAQERRKKVGTGRGRARSRKPKTEGEPKPKKAAGTGKGRARARPPRQKPGKDATDSSEIIKNQPNSSSGESQDEQRTKKEVKESSIQKPIVTGSSSRTARKSAQMAKKKILLFQRNSDEENSDKEDNDEVDDDDDNLSDILNSSINIKLELEEMGSTEDEDYN